MVNVPLSLCSPSCSIVPTCYRSDINSSADKSASAFANSRKLRTLLRRPRKHPQTLPQNSSPTSYTTKDHRPSHSLQIVNHAGCGWRWLATAANGDALMPSATTSHACRTKTHRSHLLHQLEERSCRCRMTGPACDRLLARLRGGRMAKLPHLAAVDARAVFKQLRCRL